APLPEDLPHIAQRAPSTRPRRLEARLRFEQEDDAGELLAEFVDRDEPPAERRVHDVDAATRQALEDGQVTEAPVQDRRRLQDGEIVHFEANATPAQTERACDLEEAQRRQTIAPGSLSTGVGRSLALTGPASRVRRPPFVRCNP